VIPFVMLIAGLLKLLFQCAKRPIESIQLTLMVGGFYIRVLASSARERFDSGGWASLDLTAIFREANRRLTQRCALVIGQFLLKVDDRVTQLELLNVDYAKAHVKMAAAINAYYSSLKEWHRYSAPPPGLGALGGAFATAMRDYLIVTPSVAKLLVNDKATTGDARALTLEHRIERPPIEIPKAGDYLLRLFLPKKDRESIPGDLEEEFPFMVEKFGAGLAKLWYWVQVLSTIGAVAGDRLWRLWRFLVAAILFRHFGS
jgi:hypothetical protein